MTTRIVPGYWESISSALIQGGDAKGWIRADYEHARASDQVYMYANMRHNILAVPFLGVDSSRSASSSAYVVSPVPANDANQVYFCEVPIWGRVVFPGNLRVWVYCKTSSAEASNVVKITAYAPNCISQSTTVASTSTAWYSIDLTLPELVPETTYGNDHFGNSNKRLLLKATRDPGAANTLTVYSVCAYQRQVSATPAHVSLAAVGNLIGADDKPMSAAVAKLLQDEVNCQYAQRMPRSNVVAHWFSPMHTGLVTANYSAAADQLGQYKFVKRAGCSALYVYACVNAYSTLDWNLQTSIASTVEGTAEAHDINSNGGMAYWVGNKFTFTTANTAIEKELTAKFDAKRHDTDNAYGLLYGLCITEKPPSAASVAHTIPDPSQYYASSYIESAQVENERATLTNLWQHQPAIAMSDWRTSTLSGSRNAVKCMTATFTKSGPTPTALLSAAEYPCSCIARALVFPSYGCSRIRLTVGFETYMGHFAPEDTSDERKYIYMQITDSTVNATNQWDGPSIFEDYLGAYQGEYFSGLFTPEWQPVEPRFAGVQYTSEWFYNHNGMPRSWSVRGTTTPVSSSRWITPTSTITPASLVNPIQVWVWGWSDSTADYVSPTYVAIEEIPLTSGEFP